MSSLLEAIMSKTYRSGATSGGTGPAQTEPAAQQLEPSNHASQADLGKARYEAAFGSFIGGKLWDLVSDNITAEALNEHLVKGEESAAKWLYEQLREGASPEQQGDVELLRTQLRDLIHSDFVAPLQASGAGSALEEWAAENPYGVAGLGLAGAAGYIASNPELDGDLSQRLGENHKFSLGGEFGQLFDPRVDAVRGRYQYEDADTRLRLSGEQRFDMDQWSLAGEYQQQTPLGLFSADGSYTQGPDSFRGTAGLGFENEDMEARLQGSYDSATDLGRLSGNLATSYDEGLNWTAGFDADTEGAFHGNLGVTEWRDNLGWYAGAGGGWDAEGQRELQAMAGLRVRF